ncbi:zeatin O-glucosyltransferase-like, partial [Rhododendron vialii]|uniref:zeatin O-glucosyltransferase-like n=1 Tax=Rhododendron vialii TaxID=182163 RepID=UPI00265F7CC1
SPACIAISTNSSNSPASSPPPTTSPSATPPLPPTSARSNSVSTPKLTSKTPISTSTNSPPPPDPNSSSKFPSHLLPSFEASIQIRDPVVALLREISNTATRVVVIHDFNMAYVVQDVATIPNAESYIFCSISGFFMSFISLKDHESFHSFEELKGLSTIQGDLTPEVLKFTTLQADFRSLAAGTIFNTHADQLKVLFE